MGVTYRFRDATKLLDHKELEDQYVYCCAPHQLNDPSEGVRDTVWKGDKILWMNFFRHYLLSLGVYYSVLNLKGQNRKLTSDDIHVRGLIGIPAARRGAHPPADQFHETVFRRSSIGDLVASIGSRAIRHGEVLQYLEVIHVTATTAMLEIFERKSLPTGSESKILLDKMSRIISRFSDDLRRTVLGTYKAIWDGMKLQMRLELPEPQSSLEENWQSLILDFPRNYLDRLDTLLYPMWYVACFTEDIRNSSMWGHYADGHRGICLIFATDSAGSVETIALNCVTGYSSTGTRHNKHRSLVPMRLYRVEYGTTQREVDFFRSKGNVRKKELAALWYSDENGSVSDLSHHIGEMEWREDYWSRFAPAVSSKSIDWTYERERRLVLCDDLGFFGGPRRPKIDIRVSDTKGNCLRDQNTRRDEETDNPHHCGEV